MTFDDFWKEYPRKVGKKDAERAWKKINPGLALTELIINSVKAQRKWPEHWARENGKYIPNPATWLNQGRWEDQSSRPLIPERPPSQPSKPTYIPPGSREGLSEMGREALKLAKMKTEGKLTAEDYVAELYLLDKTFPGYGWKEEAEKYQIWKEQFDAQWNGRDLGLSTSLDNNADPDIKQQELTIPSGRTATDVEHDPKGDSQESDPLPELREEENGPEPGDREQMEPPPPVDSAPPDMLPLPFDDAPEDFGEEPQT